jgi:hypothetical protein
MAILGRECGDCGCVPLNRKRESEAVDPRGGFDGGGGTTRELCPFAYAMRTQFA